MSRQALEPGSLPGFGGDQFPVRIARCEIACEGPYVGDVGHPIRIAVDEAARAIARNGNELRHESHGDLSRASAQLGADDVSLVDGDKACLRGLAAGLAISD